MVAYAHLPHEKFDGLAEDYDAYRPRYPAPRLINIMLAPFQEKRGLSIVDVGAGTGIALEPIIQQLGDEQNYHAIEISSDMINQGKVKFPQVHWHHGPAETVLPKLGAIDLLVAAQAFQWMERAQLLQALARQLRKGSAIAVIQNNRNFHESAFLDEYESLLEQMSPNYSRFYRAFDFAKEMSQGLQVALEKVAVHKHNWARQLPINAFLGMNRSSTQAQRAIAKHGTLFWKELKELIQKYSKDDQITILYESELYLYVH